MFDEDAMNEIAKTALEAVLAQDIPIPAPRFDALVPRESRCIGMATTVGIWPFCKLCQRRDLTLPMGWFVAPAALISSNGATCANRLVD